MSATRYRQFDLGGCIAWCIAPFPIIVEQPNIWFHLRVYSRGGHTRALTQCRPNRIDESRDSSLGFTPDTLRRRRRIRITIGARSCPRKTCLDRLETGFKLTNTYPKIVRVLVVSAAVPLRYLLLLYIVSLCLLISVDSHNKDSQVVNISSIPLHESGLT
eukprot:sb/3472874/